MKKLIWLVVILLTTQLLPAQSIKRIGDRIKRKIENKTSEKIEKEIDKAVDGESAKNTKKQKDESSDSDDGASVKKSSGNNKEDEDDENTTESSGTSSGSLASYSKFDFIPGEKIIAFGNFERDAIGDFPVNWNTNATAEVVTLSNKPGRWMKINKDGTFHPEFIKEIPENFTLEFDLGHNSKYSYYSSDLALMIGHLTDFNNFKELGYYPRVGENEAIRISLHPTSAGNKNSRVAYYVSNKGNHRLDGSVEPTSWNNHSKPFAHISIWRQKTRMRIYVNEEKVFDVPKAFDMNSAYNAIVFSNNGMHNNEDFYVINNIRLAVGAPDTRNKLITEGKFVTRGILFDVNSDKIKPESYGVLKDIAAVLNENPTIKISIVGHTDADGEDAANLDLSKRRAESVKQALKNEFRVETGRIETDGKGESQPVDKNDSESGKANNRRVEFIKIN